MPVGPLLEFAPHLPARGALIGLDLGTKTIGVAVSDPDRRLATGVETVARKAFTADPVHDAALNSEVEYGPHLLGGISPGVGSLREMTPSKRDSQYLRQTNFGRLL